MKYLFLSLIDGEQTLLLVFPGPFVYYPCFRASLGLISTNLGSEALPFPSHEVLSKLVSCCAQAS